MIVSQTTKKQNEQQLWFHEIPADIKDSFVKIGSRKLAVVGFGIKRASQFKAHPENWRVHPPHQQSAKEMK